MRARICCTASSTALLGSLSCAETSSTLACAGAASRLGTRTVNAGVIVRTALTHQHIKIRAEGVRSVVVSGLLPEASFMREAFLQLPQQAACHSQEQSKWVAPAGVKHFMLIKGSVGQQQANRSVQGLGVTLSCPPGRALVSTAGKEGLGERSTTEEEALLLRRIASASLCVQPRQQSRASALWVLPACSSFRACMCQGMRSIAIFARHVCFQHHAQETQPE